MAVHRMGCDKLRAVALEHRRHRERELAGRPGSVLGTLMFRVASTSLGLGLKVLGLLPRGRNNALTPRITVLQVNHPHIPAAFDNYTILHLTDFHFDCMPEVVVSVKSVVNGLHFDLCLMTGDYTDRESTPLQETLAALGQVLPYLRCTDGILATLGNHDSAKLLEPLESFGVHTLVNESVRIVRGEASIDVTGIDDVRLFRTSAAEQALQLPGEGFRIAAVHSPEIADIAADAGHSLYLCGHTHGGQIRLPGLPMATGLTRMHHLRTGVWNEGGMMGYTSNGIGVSNIPMRFNAEPEITLIRLRSAPSVSIRRDPAEQ